MTTNIDKIISQTIHIAKYIAGAGTQSFEERTATILQYHALSFLEHNGGVKLTDVANHIHASLSSTTQLIERLHKAGLIERKGDDNDRRVSLLSVTKEGLEKLQQMKETKRERMEELLATLSKEEVNQLITIQEKLVQQLQK